LQQNKGGTNASNKDGRDCFFWMLQIIKHSRKRDPGERIFFGQLSAKLVYSEIKVQRHYNNAGGWIQTYAPEAQRKIAFEPIALTTPSNLL